MKNWEISFHTYMALAKITLGQSWKLKTIFSHFLFANDWKKVTFKFVAND